ncbi:hypothetical protein HHI36_022158 [Cryptolaemus montrouzieri]|uniref:Uncharacterized protein n=1 Tax=Cryptolaemus montrouzieri TaxID=559131 RepID=A0ABD2MZQ4_9CUCU
MGGQKVHEGMEYNVVLVLATTAVTEQTNVRHFLVVHFSRNYVFFKRVQNSRRNFHRSPSGQFFSPGMKKRLCRFLIHNAEIVETFASNRTLAESAFSEVSTPVADRNKE